MPIEENKEIARRFIIDVYEQGDETAATDLIAANLLVHGRTPPAHLSGPDGQLYWAAAIRRSFPDGRYSVDVLVSEGDLVVNRWTVRGTHTGPFGDIAPTNKAVSATGIDILRVADGKIVELWHEMDIFGVQQQLRPAPAE